jgi:hypothetical protein
MNNIFSLVMLNLFQHLPYSGGFRNKFGMTVVIFIVVYCMLTPTCVLAQEERTLRVIPARHELTIEPGEQAGVAIKFFNHSSELITGTVGVNSFTVIDKNGTPQLLSTTNTPYSAASWVSIPYTTITIAPESFSTVQAQIVVPADAKPGSRYAAIFFQPFSTPDTDKTNVSISAKIASLISIRIPGNVEEHLTISSLSHDMLLEYGPVAVTAELANRSVTHLSPQGTFQLTDVFGKTVDAQPLKQHNIFPETTRQYSTQLGKGILLGKYKINLLVNYGNSGKVVERASYVWIIPWKILIAIALFMLLLVLVWRKKHEPGEEPNPFRDQLKQRAD